MRAIVFIFLYLYAGAVSAQVLISEIMYDSQDGDTGHEWVEIFNYGIDAVELSMSKFTEGGSNHGLTALQGGDLLASGAFAIIADNAQVFLSDHVGFSGTVLDSSFSLKNSGETISFRMPDSIVSDTVVYASDMGAAGDGDSLQKIGGAWKGGVPSPGFGAPSSNSVATTNTLSSDPIIPPSYSSAVNTPASSVSPHIIADAGASTRTVATGAPVILSGKAFGLEKEPIENARIIWSFGDGGTGEGQTVLHTYYYPGEYIVVLDAASGYYSASDRVRVTVVKPELILETGGDTAHSFVAIENKGNEEIDLSGWLVGAGNNAFVFPKNTLIGARKILTLPSEVTKLSTPEGSIAELQYPNGTKFMFDNDMITAPEDKFLPTNIVPPPAKVLAVIPVSKISETESKKSVHAAAITPLVSNVGTTSFALSGTHSEKGIVWVWYVGVLLLGALAFLGLRFARLRRTPDELSAENFEIEEDDPRVF
jgi:hypothetical protein